jgi:TonB family protein
VSPRPLKLLALVLAMLFAWPVSALADDSATGDDDDSAADDDDSAAGDDDDSSADDDDSAADEPPATVEPEGPVPPERAPLPYPAPDVLDAPPPVYPEEALQGAVEGTVVLEFGLTADGIVEAIEVVREPGAGLGAAAAASLAETIFDDVPVEGPPLALRRYFHTVPFVLPEELRPLPPEVDPDAPEPEMADELTVLPELVQETPADYPPMAEEAGVQGEVTLELDVSDTGIIDSVRLLSATPGGWGFELAALRAVWQFRFSPAYAGEVPVPVRITYTYRFILEELIVLEQATTPGAGDAIDPDGPVNLSGYVREMGSRKGLADVDVYIENLAHGTLSDDLGYFEFRGIPAGAHRVLIAIPGYLKFETEEEVDVGEATDVVYFVRPSPFGVPETVVRASRERKEVTRRTIEVETIERIPGTFGDPVKVVQNLPGVARSPFDFGLLLVRGSGPEDSGAHIDGIRVPQLFHFGGFRSIVTPILLDSIDFYPGGYGGSYGRLTGGILDVQTRATYEDVIHGMIQADLLDISAAVVGPIRKKGERYPIGGFVFAARRSYLDIILPVLAPNDVDLSRTIFPQWTDVQGKLSLNLGKGHSLSWLAYWSQDRAGTRLDDPGVSTEESSQGEIRFRNDFWRVTADWGYRSDGVLDNRMTFAVGQDIQAFELGQFGKVDLESFWIMLRDHTDLDLHETLTLRLGTDVITSIYDFEFNFFDFDVRTFGADPNAERDELILGDEGWAFAPGFFAEAQVKLVDERIRLTPGLRLDWYTVPGQFSFVSLDPRFTFRVTPDPDKRLDIKGSVGIYHQNPQAYEILEVTGDTDLKPEESYQVSLGTDIQFTDFLSLDVTGFYKRLTRLVTFQSGDVTTGGSDAAWVNSGDGHIYGAELFLRWQSFRNFEGWIALTLQRSQRRDAPDEGFYWYDFDQPVILDVVASYNLPFGFRIGARWRYVSGNPDTPINNAIYDADSDSYLPLSGEYNSGRLPDFHALDIRIDKDFVFRRWKLTAYLDLMNIYNRKNPESTIYNFDYTEKTFLYGLPIIPNLGIKAQF